MKKTQTLVDFINSILPNSYDDYHMDLFNEECGDYEVIEKERKD